MDRGIRPYASSAKNYNEMMDEETEQYYKSRNFTINPSLKQPYTFNNYTEMMYLYSGGEQRPSSDKSTMDANMFPVVLATVTSPDYEFFDFFVEQVVTSNYLVNEDFTNLDDWTIETFGSDVTYEISPAGEYHCVINYDSDRFPNYCVATTSFDSTPTPSNHTIEIEMNIDSMGVDATPINTSVQIGFGGTTNFFIIFSMSGVFVNDGNDYTQIGTVVPTTGTYKKWKIVNTAVDESSSSCELFLEDVSQGTLPMFYALDSPLSGLYLTNQSKVVDTLETHTRDIKLYYE
jgi:hypothetical protein